MASKLVTGFALGIIVGILIAPDKGGETRKKIAQKGKDLKHKFNDFVDSIEEKFGSAAEEVEEAAAGIKQKVPTYSDSGAAWAG